MKSRKDLIYESFHEYKHGNFVNFGYGTINLERTETQVQSYKKGTNFIL